VPTCCDRVVDALSLIRPDNWPSGRHDTSRGPKAPAHQRLSARTGSLAVCLAVVVLAGCQPGTGTGSHPVITSATTAGPAAALDLPSRVPYSAPVQIGVRNGKLRAVTVQQATGAALPGVVSASGTTWTSTGTPVPGGRYHVIASASQSNGHATTLDGSFRVTAVPDAQRLTLTWSPGRGSVVGVGQPIVIRFDQTVTDRAAVERAFIVSTSKPVVGAWHWVGPRELHFRPRTYWPARATVDAKLNLNGVHAGPRLWGGRDYESRFTIGDKHVTVVNARAETLTVRDQGRVLHRWPTSLGQPQFATRNGTYVVLTRTPRIHMTSCSASIQCKKGAPNYYALWVNWDVRLTDSGTFIHAAPWSVASQGRANVSHGCINLSTIHGNWYYNFSRPGDVVTVIHSTRNDRDLVASGDPGMADWNWTPAQWLAGSALGTWITTHGLV
jgi:lipoprotein-anchoring transpeptidase ErfK/SrfK